MNPITSTITVSVLKHLVTDIIRFAANERVEPLDQAIQSTANSFPNLEGVEETLRRWLRSPSVAETIGRYARGESARDDLSIPSLASDLVNNTGFYLGEHSQAAAEKILSTFLSKVHATYLTSPAGTLHIANRQEAGFDMMKQLMQQLTTTVESAGGLKPALQTHFDRAMAHLDSGEFPAAKVLFESLLAEIERSPVRDPSLERRCHASLGQAFANLGRSDRAVEHYRKAAALDNDPVRAAVNTAVADLTEDKPEAALQGLESVASAETSSAVFEFSAAKVGALLGLKRHEEALATAHAINVQGKEARRLELIGLVNRQGGRLTDAEEAYRAALGLDSSRPELQYSLSEVLFAPAVQYSNKNPGTPLPPDLRERLDEAADLLTKAIAGLQNQGRDRAVGEISSALAVVRLLQHRYQEAIILLEPVVKTPEANANDWRNLGFAYILTNQGEKAATAFRHAFALGSDSKDEFFLAHALMMGGKHREALDIAVNRAVEPVTTENLMWHITKARALVAIRQFSSAEIAIGVVQQHFAADAETLLTLAELNEAIGNDAAAIEAYEGALRNATGGDEIRVRYSFGGFAASRKNFSRAVELWKPLIDPAKPDTLLDNYARALYHSGNLEELTSIAADIRKSGSKASAGFAEVAAAAYQELDDLQEAEYWWEYACNNFGNKPEFIVQLASVKLRLGQRGEAVELLDASKATLKEAKDIVGYAQAYLLVGRFSDALELADHASTLTEDPEIHMASIAVFLSVPETVERTPQQIARHQDVLQSFTTRFPKSNQLRSFTIDPDHPLDAIRETLERGSKQATEAIAAYRQKRMPLQMFADMLGKDLYDTWFALISSPDLPLFSGTGTEEEQVEAQRLLEGATGFIIDPIALFTWCFLGHSSALSKIGDIYVAQKTLDYLHETQAKKSVPESGTMGMIDGNFFFQKVTPDDLGKRNAALNRAVAWAEAEARPAGLKAPLTEEETKWLRFLGQANVATIAIARQRGLVLITDDKILGEIAKQNYGVPSVNTQATLSYLRQHEHLTQTDYDRAVVKSLEAGYTTRVDDAQLYGVILEEQFQVTPRLRSVLRVLEPAAAPLATVCAIAASIIRRMFLETIPDETRMPAVFLILDTIAKNHPKIQVQRLVRGFLRQQMRPLLTLQLKKVEELLDRW